MTEAGYENSFEVAGHETISNLESTRFETRGLSALVVGSALVIAPVTAAVLVGSRAAENIRESKIVERAKPFISKEAEMLIHVFKSISRGSPKLKS